MVSDEIKNLEKWYVNDRTTKIGRNILMPCLKECNKYRRGTGTFGSSFLHSYLGAISDVVKTGTTIEIICSMNNIYNDKTLYNAIKKTETAEQKNKVVQNSINNMALIIAGCRTEKPQDYFHKLIAYLLAKKQLVIKFALPLHEGVDGYQDSGSESDINNRAMYHFKYGYFEYDDGHIIAFNGSVNETETALRYNGEIVNIYRSWEKSHNEDVKYLKKKIDADWEGETEGFEYYEVSEETLEEIKKHSPKKKPKEEDFPKKPVTIEPEQPHKEEEKEEKDEIDLREYQKEALQKWKDASHKGILAMATGTGKTRTAIAGIKRFRKEHALTSVVIVLPSIVLAEQWIFELNKFNEKTIAAFTGHPSWEDEINNQKISLSLSTAFQFKCIVAVSKTFNSDKFQRNLESLFTVKESIKKLIIVDECHHYNKPHTIKYLPETFDFRLGLSATPFNQYELEEEEEEEEEDGKNLRFLNKYFIDIVFEYTLEQAIPKYLTRYNYNIIQVSLDAEETDEYITIAKEIKRLSAVARNDPDFQTPLNIKYSERSRLMSRVKNKLVELDKLLENIQKTPSIAYCGSSSDEDESGERLRNIESVAKIFNNKSWKVGKITADETVKFRMEQIKDLEKNHLNVIVSIKVLDEGIDIPCCQTAFILSSSKSNRQWVQRRGRILRKFEGKEITDIYDFVVTKGANNSEEILDLIEDEQSRVDEFQKLASNKL